MMKAQVRDDSDPVVLQVCGRIAESWAAELRRYWYAAKADHPGRPFSVDLRWVTFIDPSGEELLREMHRDGATFQAAGLLIQEVVNQITGGSK